MGSANRFLVRRKGPAASVAYEAPSKGQAETDTHAIVDSVAFPREIRCDGVFQLLNDTSQRASGPHAVIAGHSAVFPLVEGDNRPNCLHQAEGPRPLQKAVG